MSSQNMAQRQLKWRRKVNPNYTEAPASASEELRPMNPTSSSSSANAVDVQNQRFPYAVVWTPLYPLTACIPCIGHMGICNSEGVIFDFAGPYYIGVDNMAFGKATRYLPLDSGKIRNEDWDTSVAHGCAVYETRMHNLCCDNCHSHVAECLNKMEYNGSTNYNMVWLALWIFFAGKFTNTAAVFKQFLPFIVILGFALFLGYV